MMVIGVALLSAAVFCICPAALDNRVRLKQPKNTGLQSRHMKK